MKLTPREAVCQYQAWDYSEASDSRYHYGRTAIPVYSTYDGYVCATANGKLPPKTDNQGFEYNWKEATGSTAEFLKSNGKTIWLSGE